MWPDRRLIDLLGIEHPLVLAPMAGIGTVGLAAAVCEAGGLGSIGCGTMEPALAAETIRALRGLTRRPINVNFFCHVPAKAEACRELAWRDRLALYYRELGIDRASPLPGTDLAPFGDALCAIVENAERCVYANSSPPGSRSQIWLPLVLATQISPVAGWVTLLTKMPCGWVNP